MSIECIIHIYHIDIISYMYIVDVDIKVLLYGMLLR